MCSFPNCERVTIAHGLCPAHYAQRRNGKELTTLRKTAPRVPSGGVCVIVDCDTPAKTQGLCVRHYATKIRYNLTVDEFVTIQNSHALCELCHEKPATDIDHDHATGRVRGYLCASCNLGLGMFKDNAAALERAISYLAASN